MWNSVLCSVCFNHTEFYGRYVPSCHKCGYGYGRGNLSFELAQKNLERIKASNEQREYIK